VEPFCRFSLKHLYTDLPSLRDFRSCLYTIAGCNPGVGCTSITRGLVRALLYRRECAQVYLFSHHYDVISIAHPRKDSLFASRLESPNNPVLLKSFDTLFKKSRYHTFTADGPDQFVFIDSGARYTKQQFDYFLIADVPILIVEPGPYTIQQIQTFFIYTFMRLFDIFFPNHPTQSREIMRAFNHATLIFEQAAQQLNVLQKSHPREVKEVEQRLRRFVPFVVINRVTPDTLSEFITAYIAASPLSFFPRTTLLGSLELQGRPFFFKFQSTPPNDTLDNIERVEEIMEIKIQRFLNGSY